ncbi:hypothetical protein [Vibrio sp. Vb0301]|uniref:hypothetical protein n=1 Tax=Vibrio sp. Vb0301 TaxID=3074622 RepID=UPI002964140B|nr:hypothetical protein [Vibrio sp. Vb0301]MDW2009933.1 hypothetical protein [Vibrio sp. Vb0301]
MNKHLMTLALLFSSACLAEIQPTTATACIETTGNESVDRATAKAIAKGRLVLDLNSVVTVRSHIEKVTTETSDSYDVTDKMTENIDSSGQLRLRGVQTTKSYYKEINGIKNYCVTLQI